MQYAVCTVPVAPVRTGPHHQGEMTTQLLFGEYCIITETATGGFMKIAVKADGYEGWCQQQHVTIIEKEIFELQQTKLAAGWVNEIMVDGAAMHIPYGSVLTEAAGFGGEVWDSLVAKPGAGEIRKVAFTFLNTPYLWGGRSVFGIDCSGFTQSVYRFFNIALLRDAYQQATQGHTVDFLHQAKCGDLAFFDNEEGQIIHVGILLNEAEIIHASGKVRVDHIDNGGIINKQSGERTQKLRIIKRYF